MLVYPLYKDFSKFLEQKNAKKPRHFCGASVLANCVKPLSNKGPEENEPPGDGCHGCHGLMMVDDGWCIEANMVDILGIYSEYVNMNEHDDQAVDFGVPNVYQPLYWNVWNTLEYTI